MPWESTDVDAVAFMDDRGILQAQIISPDLWRKFSKPLYIGRCDIIHSGGKKVFFTQTVTSKQFITT